jgi:hypothetical protein
MFQRFIIDDLGRDLIERETFLVISETAPRIIKREEHLVVTVRSSCGT